jgi:hypothetical protein
MGIVKEVVRFFEGPNDSNTRSAPRDPEYPAGTK